LIIPESLPKTKPKACNFGLKEAFGEYSVIYDAEDIPERDQIKKAILAFKQLPPDVACVQAKLNFYNPKQNLLTKLFTAEYSLWFDLILTGLQSINAPIPLGGTSNYFRTRSLRELKGWDAFNVTEDCDLGIRLSKRGYRTTIMDSTTNEEANSEPLNWFNQRTRWIKGYIQTFSVHMRNPSAFTKQYGFRNLLIFQLVVGGKVLSMLVNPLMWLITFIYFALRPILGTFIESFFPGPVLYLGVISLVLGNFLYLYYYMIGCAKRGNFSLIKYSLFVPFYWLFISIAAFSAIYRLIKEPHYWSKTNHGLHLSYFEEQNQSLSKNFGYV
jgi:glycosyltransferase XagB